MISLIFTEAPGKTVLKGVSTDNHFFCWLKHEEDEEKSTTVQKHSGEGYKIAAQLFFFLLLRRVEGQGWEGVLAVLGEIRGGVLFGMLSLMAPLVYRSRIVGGLNQEHA